MSATVTPIREDPTVLPRCCGAEPEAFCTCRGALLAYVTGHWAHVGWCLDCWLYGTPCPNPAAHTGCERPEPVTCPHGTCREAADPLSVVCAYGMGPCCGRCCWVREETP